MDIRLAEYRHSEHGRRFGSARLFLYWLGIGDQADHVGGGVPNPPVLVGWADNH